MLLYCLAALAVVIYYFWDKSQFWRRQGVNTPPQNLFFGNLLQMEREFDLKNTLWRWQTEIGETNYGIRLPGCQMYVVGDPELIKEVRIKHFEKLYGRIHDFYRADVKEMPSLVASAPSWQRVRGAMEPALNSQSVKEFESQIRLVMGEMLKQFASHPENVETDLRKTIVEATVHNSFQFVFGVLEPWKYPEAVEKAAATAREVFERPSISNDYITLAICLIRGVTTVFDPLFAKYIVPKYLPSKDRTYMELIKIMAQVKKQIDNGEQTEVSALQYFLTKLTDSVEEVDQLKMRNKVEKTLTLEEIYVNSITLLLTALATSPILIATIVCRMATNKGSQEKLHCELKKHFNTWEDITIPELTSIDYLDWVIKETSRLGHSAIWPQVRVCAETVRLSNGVELHPGDAVAPNLKAMSMNPEYFGDDIGAFKPERFDPALAHNQSRPTTAFTPFGYGPRMCIGKNFGLLSLKYILATIVLEYEVIETENTIVNSTGSTGNVFPHVHVKLRRRSQS